MSGRIRLFEHSSMLPATRGGTPLAPDAPRTRSSRATTTLIVRLRKAVAYADTEQARELRHKLRALERATQVHLEAVRFEALEDVIALLKTMHATFAGPLQRAVMDGKEVPLEQLDAEITQMLAARRRLDEP